jgi:hypothetical protein
MNAQLALTRHQAILATFALKLSGAIQELKDRLQAHYEHLYPGQAELVRAAIDDAEALAWRLSSFPHLFLPDLVEARIEELSLQPAFVGSEPALSYAA